MTTKINFIEQAYCYKPNLSAMEKEKIEFLSEIASDILEKKILGNVVECGVWKGGSARLLATIFKDKKIYLFDSFEGFIKNDTLTNHYNKGSFSDTSLKNVQEYLSDKTNCIFCPGWFPETISCIKEEKEKFCFVYLDMDHYQSTIDALNFFWDKLSTNGVILFDDWKNHCCPGIEKAIEDFFKCIDYEIKTIKNMCAIYKK